MARLTADQLTFGIEIECLFPDETKEEFSFDSYGQIYEQECDFLPEGWKAKADWSIRSESGFFGVEVVSPILQGEDGLIQVVYVMDFMKEAGIKVNNSTGLHIHIGAKDLRTDQLKILVENFKGIEKFIFTMNGEKTGIRYNPPSLADYCKPSARWDSREDREDRYRSLNQTNYWDSRNGTGNKNTIEFRLFAATTEAGIGVAAIYICSALFVKSVNRGLLGFTEDMTREQVFRMLFNDSEEDRIVVDGECWDILLHTGRQNKKAKKIFNI